MKYRKRAILDYLYVFWKSRKASGHNDFASKNQKKGRGVGQEKETAWKVPSNCACFSSRLGMGDL